MTETLNLTRLTGDHIGDASVVSSFVTDVYIYVGAGNGSFKYDDETAEFVEDEDTGDYIVNTVSLHSVLVTDDAQLSDVHANIKTVDILPHEVFSVSVAGRKLFLKSGIVKQQSLDVSLVRDEVFTSVVRYEHNANVSDMQGDPTYIKHYLYEEDVNSNVVIARYNGLRNFIVNELPLPTNQTTSFSVEIGMTNDGSLFDLSYQITPSKIPDGE